jgi:hypothetical protein
MIKRRKVGVPSFWWYSGNSPQYRSSIQEENGTISNAVAV